MNQNNKSVLVSVQLFDKFNSPFSVNATVKELNFTRKGKRHRLLNILIRTSGIQRHAAVT